MADEQVEATEAMEHGGPVALAQRLEQGCTLAELRGLCFRLGIDEENLAWQTKGELARGLALYCGRQGRLGELAKVFGELQGGRQDSVAAYRRRLLEETQFVELRGIPLPVDRDGRRRQPRVPLDRVYIHLQAVAEDEKRKREEAEAQRLAEMAAGERAGVGTDFLGGVRTLGEYLYRRGQVYQAAERPAPVDPQAALEEHGRLVVLGAPGAGKSTMLRYLARRAAENERRFLPLVVSLRDFAIAHARDGQSLRCFALEYLSAGDDRLRQALEAAVEAGQVLWLLDALDEARGLAGEAARQASQLPGRLIVTSRPVWYVAGPLQALPHFEVLPLAPADVDQFLHNWFSIAAGEAAGAAEGVAARVAHLQGQLKARPQIEALGRNPLLLTFLATLVSQDSQAELPGERAELYRRYVEELLAQREEGRRAQVEGAGDAVLQLGPLRAEAAREAALQGFYYLGWALHLNYYGGRSEAAPDEAALRRRLAAYFEQEGTAEAGIVAGAVFEFWREAGMVDVWQIGGHRYLAFRHLTFQEYAAAWGLAEAWRRDRKRAWRFLLPRLHHYAWREPILLLAGVMEESDLNELVRRLLRGHSPDERVLYRDLRLAGALLAEGATIEARLKQRVLSRLLRLATSRYPHRLPRLALYLGRTIGNKEPIFTLLGQIGEAAVPHLIIALGDSDRFVRRYAAQALGEIGDATTVPHLIIALGDSEWPVRQYAAYALGQIGDAAAVPHLMNALISSDRFVRESIAQALGQLGKVPPPLASDLGRSDRFVRVSAIQALGQLDKAAAVPRHITALGDSNNDVRASAAQALGQIGETAAVPHLITVLDDSDSTVRALVAQALGQIGEATAVPPLITALSDSDWYVRQCAAQALGCIGEATAVPDLITALGDSNSDVRWAAAEALGQISEAAAVPHLIGALSDRNSYVRESAAEALGQTGEATAVSHLIAALGDSQWQVRWTAAGALGYIGEAAVPHLITALGDSDGGVRGAAAWALGQIGPWISDQLQLRQVKRALWWRLADTDSALHWRTVTEVAFDVLEKVAARLVVLEVGELALEDPLLAVKSRQLAVGRKQWTMRWVRYLLGVVAVALLAVLVETVASLLAEYLGTRVPAGVVGVVVLGVGIVVLVGLSRVVSENGG